jgi:hypothetical protein
MLTNEDYRIKYTTISRLRVQSFLFKAMRQVSLMHAVSIYRIAESRVNHGNWLTFL